MRIQQDPSLIRSIGLLTRLTNQTNDETITIIQNHYLKNIREELMEENTTLIKHPDNEIAYVIANVYGISIKFMIDMGANVSLIDANMYNKIQKESKVSLPTLPVSNIVLIGATGRQNKTIKKQVSLEVMSNHETLSMIFLIAHNLPFEILIGCDILRKYSAIIDMRLSKVTMRHENKEWMAELTGSKGVVPISTVYNIRTICDSPDKMCIRDIYSNSHCR